MRESREKIVIGADAMSSDAMPSSAALSNAMPSCAIRPMAVARVAMTAAHDAAAAARVALTVVALAFALIFAVGSLVGCASSLGDPSGQPDDSGQLGAEEGIVPDVAFLADGLSTNYDDARENSIYLQYLIDLVSRQGGGTVVIPEGTYCFAATGEHELGSYAVLAKSNVLLVGSGQDATVLMPVGEWADTGLYRHGVDMFAHFGVDSATYLENADFQNFTIDGSLTQGKPEAYNASGKGFYFKLFKDCDWLNVTVKNTDGTGFGMDFPINSTLENCVAIGCGKNATAEDVGASGFGIGTGYSEQESILISNCEAYDNTKYGFFFEHQTRFASEIEALKAEGFVVVDCVASGNLYNFGGARAHDVTYERCTSKISGDAAREAYTTRAFCFENHSCRTAVVDCMVEQRFADVAVTDPCYVAAHWALENGLIESVVVEAEAAEGVAEGAASGAATGAADGAAQAATSGVNLQIGEMLFHPEREMLRSEAVALLWRYAGRPGEIWPGGTPSIPVGYSDVSVNDYFIDAALWMSSLGGAKEGAASTAASGKASAAASAAASGKTSAASAKFRGGDPITRAELITMLWRMAGEPEALAKVTASEETPAYEGLFFEKPYAWALGQGMLSEADFAADPNETCTRAEIVMLLQAYDAL